MVVVPPKGIVVGSAVNVVIVGAGGGGAAVTVTNAVCVAVPPVPVAVKVNEVLSGGVTFTDPDTGNVPFTPEIETELVLDVAQVRVEV
jgi:hypothetical protein